MDPTSNASNASNTSNAGPEYDLLVKCAVLGDTGVGKSSLLAHHLQGCLAATPAGTVGLEFNTTLVTAKSGRTVKFQVWDTSGDEKYRQVLTSFLRDAQVIIIVFDMSCTKSFKNLGYWFDFLPRQNGKTVFVLVGNKSDLPCAIYEHDAEQFAMIHDAIFISTSAVTGQNVSKIFDIAAAQILKTKPMSFASQPNTITAKQNCYLLGCCKIL